MDIVYACPANKTILGFHEFQLSEYDEYVCVGGGAVLPTLTNTVAIERVSSTPLII
jgi:hypothetical protein